MLKERKELPIWSYRESILETVKKNPVTVLCASTGAGKSTNAPLFLLEEALESGLGDKANIICTQPRRVAAISVAERVSDQINEKIGGSVGYHIRMESKKSKHTKLMFCTTGVILRRLQDDPDLKGVTHVCVDEVHERQWQIDFLLIALRRLVSTTRKDLKVVLVSCCVILIDILSLCACVSGCVPFQRSL
jgi:HrpA-like RNA helicase